MFNGIIFRCLAFVFIFHTFFTFMTRYSVVKSSFSGLVRSIVNSKVAKFLLITLFTTFFIVNLTGNIPLNSIPTLFYSQTLTIRLLF